MMDSINIHLDFMSIKGLTPYGFVYYDSSESVWFYCLKLLWNHFISWGLMFVGKQNFSGSWGRNFVGNLLSVYNSGVLY
jgi:hypothetical protein